MKIFLKVIVVIHLFLLIPQEVFADKINEEEIHACGAFMTRKLDYIFSECGDLQNSGQEILRKCSVTYRSIKSGAPNLYCNYYMKGTFEEENGEIKDGVIVLITIDDIEDFLELELILI